MPLPPASGEDQGQRAVQPIVWTPRLPHASNLLSPAYTPASPAPTMRRQWFVNPLWRRVAVAAYIGVNIGLILFAGNLPGPHNGDWQLWLAVRDSLGDGSYYRLDSAFPFIWSPVAAWLISAVTTVGYWPWFWLHLASLWLLRFSPVLMLLVVTSLAFWTDAIQGNAFTFVFVAGVLALRGSGKWSLAYLALVLLMPRPIHLPLAAVLLWRGRQLWFPVSVIALAQTVIVLATGQLVPWATAILGYTHADVGYNFGPTRFFGWGWLIIGVPLATWLTLRGRLGWAGLAMSPYVMAQYLMWPLLELRKR